MGFFFGLCISIGAVIGPEEVGVDAMQTFLVDTKTPYRVHSVGSVWSIGNHAHVHNSIYSMLSPGSM